MDAQMEKRVLCKGYYLTKSGDSVRLSDDTVDTRIGVGVVRKLMLYVVYTSSGEFAYKDDEYEDHPCDMLYLLLATRQTTPLLIEGGKGIMALYKRDGQGIITPFLFLDGKSIEFILSGGVLNDQGYAYNAVGLATAHCGFIEDILELRAKESIARFGADYYSGVFSVDHVTEDMLESAVIWLVNAVLLFYGVNVGACRVPQGG